MKFLAENWLWILFVVVFVGMRLSGRGGCCGQGGHAGHQHKGNETLDKATSDTQQQPQGHTH
jgi:hypothetical protein